MASKCLKRPKKLNQFQSLVQSKLLNFRIKHYSKTCVKRLLSKRPQIGFQDQLLLNTGQKYCRMLQEEHSAILSTFIKLQFAITVFVVSILELPFYTGFTAIMDTRIEISW